MAATGLSKNFRPILKPGMWELQRKPMKESVAMEKGAVIYADLAGEYTISAGTSTNQIGILAEAIVAADSDYATVGKKKYVYVQKSPMAECEFSVGAGTFTAAADLGKVVAIHSDGISLAVDTAGTRATITRFISSSRGVCQLNLAVSQS